jgi:hypothetical protein
METFTLKNNLNMIIMKQRNLTALFWAVAFCSTPLWAQTEQITVPLSNPGKPYSLDVHLLDGSIKVTTYSGTDIVIEVTSDAFKVTSDDKETKESENGMKRISRTDGYEIAVNENNNLVTVHNNSFNKRINLSLKVPKQDIKLTLNTVNNGDIEVTDIKGELELNNVNGAITATGISGSVVATTINEDVKVVFVSVDPGAAMAFSSLNGNVDITFPASIKANLKLKSDMGEIYSDFDVVVDKSQRNVNRTAGSGMYKLTIDDWVYGKINGGGPEFMMKNMQGNIYIRKAK